MLALLLAFTPLLTTAITGFLKGLPPFSNLSDAVRSPAIRILAAVISIVSVVLSAYTTGNLNGPQLDIAVQTLCLAFMTWLGSLGIFHAFFQKAGVSGTAQ